MDVACSASHTSLKALKPTQSCRRRLEHFLYERLVTLSLDDIHFVSFLVWAHLSRAVAGS